jgi:mannose-1-phosphate guanylyltransferase
MTKIAAILLSAGFGSRLAPLTDCWPKALMPIGGKPLMDYWLKMLSNQQINDVIVNTHHLRPIVLKYLQRPIYKGWVREFYEKNLLGTAGTLREVSKSLPAKTILLAHVDNWGLFEIGDFIKFHTERRPRGCLMSMMTFNSKHPSSSGIVEVDEIGVVRGFYEKQINPPGNLANAAVYLLEPELIQWVNEHPDVTDFSLHVIPNFLGKIATFHKEGLYRDIGTPESLKSAQLDKVLPMDLIEDDSWALEFKNNEIHGRIAMGN